MLVSGQLLTTYDNNYRFGYDSLSDDFSGSSLGGVNSFSGFGSGLASIRDPRQNRGKWWMHTFYWKALIFSSLNHLCHDTWCKNQQQLAFYFDVPTSESVYHFQRIAPSILKLFRKYNNNTIGFFFLADSFERLEA